MDKQSHPRKQGKITRKSTKTRKELGENQENGQKIDEESIKNPNFKCPTGRFSDSRS
jgi:hypothetical protein